MIQEHLWDISECKYHLHRLHCTTINQKPCNCSWKWHFSNYSQYTKITLSNMSDNTLWRYSFNSFTLTSYFRTPSFIQTDRLLSVLILMKIPMNLLFDDLRLRISSIPVIPFPIPCHPHVISFLWPF